MAFVKFQVKSSGQWLNILNGGTVPGTNACQGIKADTPNFLWDISNPDSGGWSLIKVQSSGQYLNVPTGGNIACQEPLPNPVSNNFLWQIGAPDSNGWSNIKVKSSGQYLNVLNNAMGNGDPVVCQGNTPNTSNFLWTQGPANSKKVNVTMKIECASLYGAQRSGGKLSEALANSYLSMEDDNGGKIEDHVNQSSFKSILNPGSQVTWKPQKNGSGNLKVAITAVSKDNGTAGNVLINVERKNDNVQADVIWTAIRPDSGADNESYTITFTLQNGNDPAITYTFDPKIRIDPNS